MARDKRATCSKSTGSKRGSHVSEENFFFLDLFIIIAINFCSFFRYQIITFGDQKNDVKILFMARV